MTRKILYLLILSTLVVSCVPKKDLVYFQGEPTPSTKVYKLANEPYRLQVNDILDVKIKADDEKKVSLFNQTETIPNQSLQQGEQSLYFNSYTVDRQGKIRFPYIGEVNVLGYTEKEVREKIEDELRKYFNDLEDIFVTVKLAGIRYTVIGEVNRNGSQVLYQNQVSIVEAIANAGDITITGDRKKVQVWRKNIDGTKKFYLDLTKVETFNHEAFYIQSNDIIYVEPLKQKSWGTGTTGVQSFTTILSVLSLVTTSILLIKTL
ncbi:polysaccharide biosynthesis/export family protein [Flavobacteriaceae bacterium F08102]|nr:polysaccharide biosynthesis/export family protein [Flavobacteriaceae bacterium F08102]